MAYVPDNNSDMIKRGVGSSRVWASIIGVYNSWLQRIQRELTEPAPWLLLKQGDVLTKQAFASFSTSDTFDEDELEQLEIEFERIRSFLVAELHPNDEDLGEIDLKLDYLIDAAKRHNKQDWVQTAIGVFFTIAVGYSMAPGQAHRLFTLASEIIKSFFVRLIP